MYHKQIGLRYGWLAALFFNRGKVAWLLMGTKCFLMLSRYTDKNGTGETVAVFQNLLSKLPYFA